MFAWKHDEGTGVYTLTMTEDELATLVAGYLTGELVRANDRWQATTGAQNLSNHIRELGEDDYGTFMAELIAVDAHRIIQHKGYLG